MSEPTKATHVVVNAAAIVNRLRESAALAPHDASPDYKRGYRDAFVIVLNVLGEKL